MREYGWMKGLYQAIHPIWEKRDDYYEKAIELPREYVVLEYGDTANYAYVFLNLTSSKGCCVSGAERYEFDFILPEAITNMLEGWTEANRLYDGTAVARGGMLFAVHGRYKKKEIAFASYAMSMDPAFKTDVDAQRKENNDIEKYLFSFIPENMLR